ncbi:serine/threonine-protein kinase [Myxococcus sp. RHSTA-1-4]|uniref:serine/threonine-protein kinase n=1 Tax=Myxococcus sp. RHSTA-1-4 TaxID=2874601 RepID=UPI001CBDE30A|nr:serine/threonine-protein kinase [Myxococcus sp. RHSTA-1-4]MBZ4421383.1 protein kinase [Myxococcus sp. RHSTA-1-4]
MSPAPTESPRFLGRYELVHPLGQGGMGEVFLAKISGAAGFEKPCIVKTILPALLKDRQFLDRFHHEAKVLVHLVHSSIAQVYDMGEADGTYYMALEYVAGVDLAYLLEQARAQGVAVPVPVALFIGQRIAEGLGYAHRKAGPDGTPLGIVHRDVSPHNVMVSYEGEVKVIDFGLAKSAARSKYTLPSTVMGKLGYMSPEQVRAEPVDHRSDIYSSGVVLWEMLAGRALIPHGTVGEMMAAMSQPVVPALQELRPDVDTALDAVVRRALEAKPDGRYARTDEWARALNGELVRSSASVGAEEVGQFVRTLCPEAFAAQRKLISKVSSSAGLRRTPLPGTGTGVYGTGPQPSSEEEEVTGFEPTVMRNASDIQPPGRRSGGVARPDAVYADGDDVDSGVTAVRQGPVPGTERSDSGGQRVRKASRPVPTVEAGDGAADEVPAPRRPSRPLPTADAGEDDALEARESRKRPVGLYAAIAVLLVIATAATTALFVRQPAVVPAPATVPASGLAVKPGSDAPGAGTAAGGENPGAAATGAVGSKTPAPGTAVAAGSPGSETPAPGTASAAGSETPAPGSADATGTATPEVVPAGGQGTPVAEAVPSSALAAAGSVAPGKADEEAVAPDAEHGKRPTSTAKSTGKKKPVTPAPAPAPAPTVRYVSPAAVLKVVDEGGRFYVERSRDAKLLPGTELEVVGPAGKDGRRPVLGLARVQKPLKSVLRLRRAYLELDDAALASSGELYLALPLASAATSGKPEAEAAAPETAESAPAEEPVKPEKKPLYGTASKQSGVSSFLDPGIKVRNLGTTTWTKCNVVKDGRKTAWLGDLKAGEERTVNRFRVNVNFDVPTNMVGVFCEEGELVIPLR